jgi:hypothetical protein
MQKAPMRDPKLLLPEAVVAEIAAALPDSARPHVILVGSLAAAYYFREDRPSDGIRTKDVDALFSPHAKAVASAKEVTEQLLDHDWTLRQAPDGKFNQPGRAEDADRDLPLVRLLPPGVAQDPDHWFLEFMSAPDRYQPGRPAKDMRRVTTKQGHFGLCSFGFLGLAEWQPMETRFGVKIARPEMMALANLLHHPFVREDRIGESEDKRSNKDLGRVIALALLAFMRQERLGNEELFDWPDQMARALRARFGDAAPGLAVRAGDGIQALLRNRTDLVQALAITERSLLAGLAVDLDGFLATARRLESWVLEPLAAAF